MKGQRVGVAGVGLIGGSIAFRARAAGAHVTGLDHDRATAASALERGAIEAVAPTLDILVRNCDLLVIALPLDATAIALDGLTHLTGPELVIDVASVKGCLQPYAARLPTYIGTHPMAGRERGGIDAADARLFENATWAHAPHADRALVRRLRTFIEAMGARALEIDAARHDEIVGLTSHLPQALSVALGAQIARAMESDPDVIELCGPGMMSMLRLARSPAAMWSQIIAANAGPLARNLRSLARALSEAAEGLDRGDSDSLMSYFGCANGVNAALEERFSSTSRS